MQLAREAHPVQMSVASHAVGRDSSPP
jgi:hypothetical protein